MPLMMWLILGSLVVAAIGLYLGYDEALAVLLAPLFGLGKHKERAEEARTEGDVYRDMSETHVNKSQAYLTDADGFHEQQTRLAERTDANEDIPIDKVVDDVKKDWD